MTRGSVSSLMMLLNRDLPCREVERKALLILPVVSGYCVTRIHGMRTRAGPLAVGSKRRRSDISTCRRSLPKTRESKHQISRGLILKLCHPLAEDSLVRCSAVPLICRPRFPPGGPGWL